MSTYRFEKIVRDLTPEILKKEGATVHLKKLTEDEKIQALKDKLREEVEEIYQSNTRDDLIEEVADFLDVLDVTLSQKNISWQEIENQRQTKKEKRGSFNACTYVKSIDIQTNKPAHQYFEEKPRDYPKLHTEQVGDFEIVLHEHKHAPTDQKILEWILAFNAPYFGDKRAQYFTISLNHNGELSGGLTGFIRSTVCYINLVFIDESFRHQKLGSKIIEQVENFARHHECRKIDLETYEFQALPFYQKLGFHILGHIPNGLGGQDM